MAIIAGCRVPMVGDRGRTRPPATPLSALSRDQIPTYELKVAGAADPANASPSLVAILGDSRLKMMEYVGSMVFTADGRSLISAANHEIAFWDPAHRRATARLRGHTDRVMPWRSAGTGGHWSPAATTTWSRSGTSPRARSGSRSRGMRTRRRCGHQPRRQASSPRSTTRFDSGTSRAAGSEST